MGALSRIDAARAAAALAGLALAVAVPVALGADGSSLRVQAAGLRAANGTLEARLNAATLELYGIQTQLARARAELDRIGARRAEVARQRDAARKQLAVARRVRVVAEGRLAEIVRALYERPDHKDPLAILLGAQSLEEALAGLDNLNRAAAETERVVAQAEAAKQKLARLDEALADRDAELSQLVAAASAHTAQLAASAADRERLVAGLRRQQGVNAARVAAIEAQVREAEVRTRQLTPAPVVPVAVEVAAPAPLAAPTVAGARTLTVSATGYALRGRTATGMQTAPGVVAVDPSVIPLGTRMTIPGYGEGIAADTGGAVHGNTIDLWFPSTAEALAWGRRTVTITIH